MGDHMTSVVLEFDQRPPSVNGGHGNRWAKAADTKRWREMGRLKMLDAIAKGAPRSVDAITVTVQQLSKNRSGLQDLGNCLMAVKAAQDGIVDAGFIPDDTFEHVQALTFLPPDICGRNGLRITLETP